MRSKIELYIALFSTALLFILFYNLNATRAKSGLFWSVFYNPIIMYKLDLNKKRTFQISNDAFFYIRDGEEPLDELNKEEALEVLEMFPYGFELGEDWEYIDGTDLVQVNLTPYKNGPDGFYKLSRVWYFQYEWLVPYEAVKIWFYNIETEEVCKQEELEVLYSDTGEPYIITSDLCRFYLKDNT